ncbi:MAG: hypothetical protein HYV62_02025 [Candidatus Rokubacteria bacterium]|nr:hypothetical protein [Candidatus Rokubacteria bacterium]
MASHLVTCAGCRAELEALRATWTLLGRWPEAAPPPPAVRTRVLRAMRCRLLRESVLTLAGWAPGVRAAVIGVAASVALSLVVPYPLLVAWCRQALQVSDPAAAPYLVAGTVYGMPLVLGAWPLQRRPRNGSTVQTLEASALFLGILGPYVVIQCREFAPALQVAFVSGLGLGAVLWAFTGLWLARLATVDRVRP